MHSYMVKFDIHEILIINIFILFLKFNVIVFNIVRHVLLGNRTENIYSISFLKIIHFLNSFEKKSFYHNSPLSCLKSFGQHSKHIQCVGSIANYSHSEKNLNFIDEIAMVQSFGPASNTIMTTILASNTIITKNKTITMLSNI